MAEKVKVTMMLLKVDLQCSKCYKKVKKVLCKFPQIQDQVYDEKNNAVIIKVVCCSPEKIRDKICCKGGGSIKSIEILKPPEKPAEKPKDQKPANPPKPAEKPKDQKPADPPKPAEKPKDQKPADPPKPAEKPKDQKPADPPKPAEKPKDQKPADPPKPDKPKVTFDLPPPQPTTPAPGYPHPLGPVPVGFCCTDCYGGRGGGPCYEQPVRYYDGYCGRPVYDSWGGGGGGGYRGYSGSRCSEYLSEENPQGCSIM